MHVTTQWVLREANNELVQQLQQSHQISRPLAHVLVARGVGNAQALNQYLNPSMNFLIDPIHFAGMAMTVERMIRAIKNNEVIGVFGDYDVDGVCSTAILTEFLRDVGVQSHAYIPNRLLEGYGLSNRGVQALYDAGVRLIVTVDCGITAHEQISFAASLGIDVIVVDHHTVPVELPKAWSVINPHRKDCERNAQHMCAAGVVFNLCIALRRALRENGYFRTIQEPNLVSLLDLVALATVADVVPLIEDNRIFVSRGMRVISESMRPGMRALLDVARVKKDKVSAQALGFYLSPRINAAGRLEHADAALRLLTTKDAQQANILAYELEQQNQSRRSIESTIVQEAIEHITSSEELLKARAIVVGSEEWHPGVVGIVASRLVDRFNKPAIVIGTGGKGSGRSVDGFHLYDALTHVADALHSFGGHAHAVGVHVPHDRLAHFRERFCATAQAMLGDKPSVKKIYFDGELSLAEVNEALIDDLQKAEPFGRSNPEPVFCIKNAQLAEVRNLEGGHVRGYVRGKMDMSFIAFGMVDKFSERSSHADLLVIPEINEWQNRRSVQLRIKDVKFSVSA